MCHPAPDQTASGDRPRLGSGQISGPAVLDTVAALVVHVGPIGAGNTAKPAKQVVVALNIAAVSDALVLAQKATLDPTTPTT